MFKLQRFYITTFWITFLTFIFFILLKIYNAMTLATINTFSSQFRYILLIEFALLIAVVIHDIWFALSNIQNVRYLDAQQRSNPDFLAEKDVSNEARTIENPIAQQYVQDLKELGFVRLGEVANELFTSFLFTNQENTVTATIRPQQESVVQVWFETVFTDGFFLKTSHNVPLNINSESLQLHGMDGTIPTVYNYHLQQQSKHREKHNEAAPVESVSQKLEHARHYRERLQPIEFEVVQSAIYKFTVLLVFSLIGYLVGCFSLWKNNIEVAFLILAIAFYIPTLVQKLPELQIMKLIQPKHQT